MPVEFNDSAALSVSLPSERPDRPLESWKEIAGYLRSKVRTCQVWERDLGLPIHRLDGSPRARVFAYRAELDHWMDRRLHEKRTRRVGSAVREKLGAKGIVLLSAIVISVTIFGLAAWRFLLRGKEPISSQRKPSLLVLSFENQTGDPDLDYLRNAIPNLLMTDLEKSGDFEVTSREKMHDLLKKMGKAGTELVDKDVGFELGEAEAVDAVILGSFTRAGEMFVTDVKVVDASTKRLLTSATARGLGGRSILEKQIDTICRQICKGWRN